MFIQSLPLKKLIITDNNTLRWKISLGTSNLIIIKNIFEFLFFVMVLNFFSQILFIYPFLFGVFICISTYFIILKPRSIIWKLINLKLV